MSYLHCPTCQRAYNFAVELSCPYCPVVATAVDPTEDIVAAAEQLARAMARASDAERDAATARMDRLALPAPGAERASFHGAMLRSIRAAIVPEPVRATVPPSRFAALPQFATIARAMIARLPAPAPRLITGGLRRVAAAVRTRMRSLAA